MFERCNINQIAFLTKLRLGCPFTLVVDIQSEALRLSEGEKSLERLQAVLFVFGAFESQLIYQRLQCY